MTGSVMLPGVEFDFGGGRVYVIPPMSLGALQIMQDKLAAVTTLNAIDPVAVTTMIEAAHLALRRNYPEMTQADVGELVDLGNVGDVYSCVMDVSGTRRKAQAAERGNEQAKSASTGLGSSPESAPTPAGPGTTSATA